MTESTIISKIWNMANTRRLCLMNLYLHNIGELDSEDFISPNDALVSDTGNRYDYVLTNPPFGKKSSITITNEDGEVEKEDLSYNRQDFWETTSNKQLNFLQHTKTLLKINGQAAVVLPDNVLFEGGAGEEIRKQLMKTVRKLWMRSSVLATLSLTQSLAKTTRGHCLPLTTGRPQ